MIFHEIYINPDLNNANNGGIEELNTDHKMILTMLDASPEEQRRSTEKFLSMLTEEEKERAMSSEFDYLDEDLLD